MKAEKSLLAVASLFVMVLLVSSILATVSITTAAGASGGAPAALSLAVGPAVLPADGGTYSAIFVSLGDAGETPTLALSPVTVLLTSSDPQVGTLLNTTVVIPAGTSTVVAKFQTSSIAGSTTITATSTGLTSGLTQLTTAIPTGYPDKIMISTVPSSVPVSLQYKGTLVLELEDQAGLPAKAVADTVVQLDSSNTALLNLSSSTLTIPAGNFTAESTFTTGRVPGVATIVATSFGFSSGSVDINIAGVSSLVLRLTALPDQAITCTSPAEPGYCNGYLVIGFSDLAGTPIRAPFPITVQLRSSSTSVIGLPVQSITIPKGNASAVVSYTTTSTPGAAVITASAAGFESGFATITTDPPSNLPLDLALAVSPSDIPADSCECAYATAYLIDQYGNATVNTTGSPISVTVTSASASVANFTDNHLAITTITIPNDAGYASVALSSTFVSGATTLTASASDLVSAQASVETLPAVPSKVLVSTLFTSFPADGGVHPTLEVSLQDASGHPYVGDSGTLVFLNSSEAGIADVSSPVDIPAGQSAVLVPVTTSFVSGVSNVTATINEPGLGFVVGSVLVSTITPAPSKVAVYINPNPLAQSPLGSKSTLFIQLEDSNGNPAKARDPTNVTVVSTNIAVYDKNFTVTISQGDDYASVPIIPLGPGTTTFEATSSNLSSGSSSIDVLPPSYQATTFDSPPSIYLNQTAVVLLTVKLDGQGLAGAVIDWNSTSGTLSTPNSTTDVDGQASVQLKPNQLGSVNVTATIRSPAVGVEYQSTLISVVPIPNSTSKSSLAKELLSFPFYLIFVAIAAVVVVVVFLFMRRRKAGGEEGEMEEEGGFSFVPRRHLGGL
jgi:hypothetical protein